MSSDPSTSPVIVVGMHRSGTTLMARLLAAAGVFMGRSLTTNFESRFFQSLNRDILDQFGYCGAQLGPIVGVMTTGTGEACALRTL